HGLVLVVAGLELADPLLALLLGVAQLLELAQLLGLLAVLAVVHAAGDHGDDGEALGEDAGAEHAIRLLGVALADSAPGVDEGEDGEADSWVLGRLALVAWLLEGGLLG